LLRGVEKHGFVLDDIIKDPQFPFLAIWEQIEKEKKEKEPATTGKNKCKKKHE